MTSHDHNLKGRAARPAGRLSRSRRDMVIIDAEETFTTPRSRPEGIIPGLINYGLILVAGRQGEGKSTLMRSIAFAMATGEPPLNAGPVSPPADVLYLDWENGHDVNLDKQLAMYPGDNRPEVKRLRYAYHAPRFDSDLWEELENWRLGTSNPRAVIIDVYSKAKPLRTPRGMMAPDADNLTLEPLQDWAHEHGVAVFILVHLSSKKPIDPSDIVASLGAVIGSSALVGTPDCRLLLLRSPAGTTLHASGRNLPRDRHVSMHFDNEWLMVAGELDEVQATSTKRAVLAALNKYGPLYRAQIAELTGIKSGTLGKALLDMKNAHMIIPQGDDRRPKYTLPGVSVEKAEIGNTNAEQPGNAGETAVTNPVTSPVTVDEVTPKPVTSNNEVTVPVTDLKPYEVKENYPSVTNLSYFSTQPNGYVLRWLQKGKKQATYSDIRMGCHPTLDADQVTEAVDSLVADGCLEIVATGPKGANTYAMTGLGKSITIDVDPNQSSMF